MKAVDRALIFLAAFWAAFSWGSAIGQTFICLPGGALTDRLQTHRNETPTGAGITNGNAVVQLFTSNDGATWTLVLHTADGRACLIASGVEWERWTKPVDPKETH